MMAPAEAKDVVHVARPEVTVTAEQPEIELPPTVKLTVPVAPDGVIVAKIEMPAPVPGSRVDAVTAVVDGVEPAALAGEDMAAATSTDEHTTADTVSIAVTRCRSRLMTG